MENILPDLEAKYYKNNRKANLFQNIMAFISVAIFTYFFSIVYIAALTIMPVVYLNMVFLIALGMLISFTSRNIGKIFKMRQKIEYQILIGFGSFMTVYFSWVIYCSTAYEGIAAVINFKLHYQIIIHPAGFFEVIGIIYEKGMWGIFGGTVKGFQLGVIWLIELTTLFIIPLYLIYKKNLPPFSNKLNKWLPLYELKTFFEYSVTTKKHIQDFENDYLTTINNLEKGMPNRFGKISIYYLSNESDAYLSFTNISIEGHGSGKTNENNLIHLLRISTEDAQNLMNKHQYNKVFYLDH